MFEELEKTLLAMNKRLDELSGKIDGIRLAPSKLTYNAAELAEILGYGKKTERIDALRKDGLLQGIRTGRKYIYPAAEVEAFLKKAGRRRRRRRRSGTRGGVCKREERVS